METIKKIIKYGLFKLLKKFLATSLIASVVYVFFYWDKKDPLALSPENKKKLDIILEKKISTAEEIFSRAEERFSLGDLKGSIQDFNEAAKLNPKLEGLNFKRGFAKFKLAELKWNFRLSISNPKKADKYHIEKILEQKFIDYEDVINELNLAIESNPKNAFAYVYRGVSKYRLRFYEESFDDFNQAINLDSRNSIAYMYRGLTKYVFEDFFGELQDYKKAIQLDPSNAEAYLYLGYTNHENKKYKEAIEYFDQALRLNPNYFNVYLFRGDSKEMLGDTIGSKEDFKQYRENIEK